MHPFRLARTLLVTFVLLSSCTSQAPTTQVPLTKTILPPPPTPIPATLAPTSEKDPTPTSVPTSTPAMHYSLTQAKLDQFEKSINEMMDLAEIPGVAIAIVEKDRVVYSKGFGVREMGKTDPVTPDTLMMIASSSKPLTTLMMATVVEDGAMSWDTPPVSILPTFATGDPTVTGQLLMRHLVCACSGFPGKDAALFLSGMTHAEDVFALLKTEQPLSKPGQQFNYNNVMVAAGGYLAAKAAGGSVSDLDAGYAAAMQERVFQPIGMLQTTLSLEEVEINPNHASPHALDLSSHYQSMPLSGERFVLPVKPAGAIWSSVKDLSALLQTLLNDGIAPNGNQIITHESLEELWNPQVKIQQSASPTYYGLGWFIEEDHGRRLIHHPGASMGFSSELALEPETGLGIVILTNGESAGGFVNTLRQLFYSLAFDEPNSPLSTFKLQVDDERSGILAFAGMLKSELDEKAIQQYEGTYNNPQIGDISLKIQAGKLLLSTQGLTSELRALSGQNEPTFVVSDPPLAVLGQLVFVLKHDKEGNTVLFMFEKNITDPYEFRRSD